MENFFKPIRVKVFYDENLKEITGKDFEEAVVSEGLNFLMFLYFIFSSYPEIEKKYPAGKLGFSLNNQRPNGNEVLNDGDEVRFYAFHF